MDSCILLQLINKLTFFLSESLKEENNCFSFTVNETRSLLECGSSLSQSVHLCVHLHA